MYKKINIEACVSRCATLLNHQPIVQRVFLVGSVHRVVNVQAVISITMVRVVWYVRTNVQLVIKTHQTVSHVPM